MLQVSGSESAPPGLIIRDLRGIEELGLVNDLFQSIWGATGPQVVMPVNLLQALVHSGNYVAGSWREDVLVAAAVAFLGRHEGVPELHSHVVGVARAEQRKGIGLALKLHQRDWALARDIRRITWTFDPLVRANAWFNLKKLGARGVRYYPDFYGLMVDELNGTDETDRCLIHWDLDRPPVGPGSAEEARPVLTASDRGAPQVHATPTWGPGPLTCQVPDDVVSMRRRDPGRAREWRLALRDTMGRAMDAGYTATSITGDGRYVLEREGG